MSFLLPSTCEAVSTLWTREDPLCTVLLHVCVQVSFQAKSLSTVDAGIVSLTGVGYHVSLQALAVPKASATYSASKRQNIPMDQIMAFENTQAWELTRTLLTFIWRLGSLVGDFMHPKFQSCREKNTATWALEPSIRRNSSFVIILRRGITVLDSHVLH